jgi:hypothetical protein
MTALMLNSDKILACPYPLVAVGISTKSYGFYYFNRQDREGSAFLGNSWATQAEPRVRKMVLPGTDMNTCWLLSMELVRANFKNEFCLRANYRRYRLLQIFRVYKDRLVDSNVESAEVAKLWKLMNLRERLAYGVPFQLATWLVALSRRVLGGARARNTARSFISRVERLINSHPPFYYQASKHKYSSIQEVFEQVDPAKYQQDEWIG